MQDIKKGAPPCGLYLVLPENWMQPDFLTSFRDLFRALNASRWERNSHVIELRVEDGRVFDEGEKEIVTALSELTRNQGIVFVLGGNAVFAKECKADGVLLERADDIDIARTLLGEDAIVGLRCGLSRRMAEKALEKGADYVSFGAPGGFIDPGLIEWWHYKSQNPCLIEGRLSNDDCDFYVRAGADFIEASSYVWEHPEGVMKGVVNMAYAIDLALEHMDHSSAARKVGSV